MKPVNLYFLAAHPAEVAAADIENLMSCRPADVYMRESELQDLEVLTGNLVRHGASVQSLAGFFCSYTIDHIGKEFDLLKIIPRRLVINIELKSKNKEPEDLKAQLLKNLYYLRGLGIPVRLFAWLESTNQLFELIVLEDRPDQACGRRGMRQWNGVNGEHEIPAYISASGRNGKAGGLAGANCPVETRAELKEIGFDVLVRLLNQQARLRYEEDLDALFLPDLYLVSPMNNPRRFLNNNYFLTAHQNAKKKEILERGSSCWAVYGEAGTGKTLFLLDLARTLSASGPVLFLHNGDLQKGHQRISAALPQVQIRCARDPGPFLDFRHILVDDAQRMDETCLEMILHHCHEQDGYAIFGYDPDQILTWTESASPVCDWFENSDIFYRFALTRRIRTNASLAAFAQALFQPSRTFPASIDLKDLQVLYAETPEQARAIHDAFEQQGYTTISYGDHFDFCRIQGLCQGEVLLGQEYEKVLVIADERFTYQKGRLVSRHHDPVYIQESLLYQGIARTRKALCILCVHNSELYEAAFYLQKKARLAATSSQSLLSLK